MSKIVELRRHTANAGDVLTPEGVRAAVDIGLGLHGGYALAVSSGAQRATQTLACMLAGLGQRVPGGVIVDPGFRSEQEERWFAAARAGGGGRLEAFLAADRDLVEADASRFAAAVRRVIASIDAGGRALVVGHSPMHEAAVYGLVGDVIEPISKGAGVLIVEEAGAFRAQAEG
jgi:broad specificity phosphatase PhoE